MCDVVHSCSSLLYSIESQVKKVVHKAFWDTFEEDITKDPPDYGHVLKLLAELKEVIKKQISVPKTFTCTLSFMDYILCRLPLSEAIFPLTVIPMFYHKLPIIPSFTLHKNFT